MLSVVSPIFEKVVYKQLYDYLDKNKMRLLSVWFSGPSFGPDVSVEVFE